MKVTVEVTQEDIDCGARYCADMCPIARALRREVEADHVEVDTDSTFLTVDRVLYRSSTPAKLKKFIHRFDNGHAVRPFKDTLEFKRHSL